MLASHSETESDQLLLMERFEEDLDNHTHQHVIDIAVTNDAPSGTSSNGDHVNQEESHHSVDRPSSSRTQISLSESSSSSSITRRVNSNPRNPSFRRAGDTYNYTSPLNSGLWISVELIVTLAQIVASVVILSLSTYKSKDAPLFAWVVGYACGCLATLPILYWRLRNCCQGPQQHSVRSHRSSTEEEEESNHNSHIVAGNSHMRGRISARLAGIVDHFKMALDCFFAVWFVVGNVWIFGAHSSPSVAPKLYRLCIVFLTFSCIGYALPFLLCATIFCCLPCIISVLGIREDLSKTRGATSESINALPTYKFKLSKDDGTDDELICLRANETEVLADGTQKERTISRDDAVCCICLAAYVDNDELRELPCSHLFHTECVDKWLKINASCPLCKLEVGDATGASSSTPTISRQETLNDDVESSFTPNNVT